MPFVRESRQSALAGLAALLALGCATARDVASDGWYELATPRFVVWTNGDPERGRALIADLERFRLVLRLHTTAEERDAAPPLRIFLTDGEVTFSALTDRNVPVFGLTGATPRGIYAVTRTGVVSGHPWEARYLLYSMSAQDAVASQGLRLPTWYAAGFSAYLGATRFEEDGAYYVGCKPPYFYKRDGSAPWLPIAELFDWDHRNAATSDPIHRAVSRYSQSWYAFHYFMRDSDRRRRLQQYLALWASEVPVPAAIERAFGMSADQLDGAIRSYAAADDFICDRVELNGSSLPVSAVAERPISVSEAQYRLGDLLLEVVGPTDETIDLLGSAAAGRRSAAALRGLARAHWMRADRKQGDRAAELQVAEQLLHEAQAIEPNSLEGLVLEGHVLRTRGELMRERGGSSGAAEIKSARLAYRKALRADETFAEAYLGLGQTYLLDDTGSEEPIAALEAAAFLVPLQPEAGLVLGTILLRRGQGPQARAALEHALQRGDAEQREQARDMLEKARALPTTAASEQHDAP